MLTCLRLVGYVLIVVWTSKLPKIVACFVSKKVVSMTTLLNLLVWKLVRYKKYLLVDHYKRNKEELLVTQLWLVWLFYSLNALQVAWIIVVDNLIGQIVLDEPFICIKSLFIVWSYGQLIMKMELKFDLMKLYKLSDC